MNKKKLLFDFFRRHKLCVISTITSTKRPSSAVMEFGEMKDLELIFDTFNSSRKYQNLLDNNHVSVVVGWDENITVQYEGIAEELVGEELKKYQKVYWEKNPRDKRWLSYKEIRYFKITPQWIRYSNLSKKPWDIFEITF